MQLIEHFTAWGHPNILGTHKTTFEFTRSQELSKRGDCVVGVNATKGAYDLNLEFRRVCARRDARITLELKATGIIEVIHGFGSQNLTFTHTHEMVGRKSEYASDRTIMVKADKAANDLSRKLVRSLGSSKTRLDIELIVTG